MRKILFTFLLLFQFINVYAELSEDLIRILKSSDSFFEIKPKIDSILESNRLYAQIDRNLIKEYNELIYYYLDNDYVVYDLKIAYSNSGKIYYIKIFQGKPDTENYEEIFSKIDSKIFEEFIQEFKIFHSLHNNLSVEIEVNEFGRLCGFVGTPPTITIKLIKSIKQKRKSELVRLMHSTNPEKQFCGALGLKILSKYYNIKLSKTEKNILSVIEKRSTKINICEGCIVGIQKPIRDLLKRKYVKRFYKSMVK